MATLRETAQAYEPPQTQNIAKLEKIPVDLDLQDGEGRNKDGAVFKYKYIVVEGVSYRVPGSVIGGIKSVLKKMPHVRYVTIDREGDGINTRYHVMPYVEAKEEVIR